jgi:hypothetical protein
VDAALRTAAARFRAALPSEPPREHLVLRWLQRTYGEATGWGALVPRVHVASFGGVMLPSAHGYLQLQVRSASFLSPPSLSLSGAGVAAASWEFCTGFVQHSRSPCPAPAGG